MLLYLHYDVQPPEPLDLWDSPPWELTKRGDHLYARGVADDKGHIIARLAALDALRDEDGGICPATSNLSLKVRKRLAVRRFTNGWMTIATC